MEALLRELREGPGRTAEYHDTEVSAEEITIGSGVGQRIQLLGRAVARAHATIRRSGARLELACRRGCEVRINGRRQSAAVLRIGDVVELGGHELRIVAPPAGFDVAIELRPDAQVDASAFAGAFRTGLEQTWLAKRPAARAIAVLVLAVGLAIPLGVTTTKRLGSEVPRWLPSDALWSSGPLHAAHRQAVGERCESCHERLFRRVRDEACRSCHDLTHDHVTADRLALTDLGEPERCATCHREHNEPASYLVIRADGLCIDCHGGQTHAFGPFERESVHGFGAARHPQFKAHLLEPVPVPSGTGTVFEWQVAVTPLDGAVEQSNLKFSHARHLDPQRVLRSGDSQPLACADCHTLSSDGEHFLPITMQDSCAVCHDLKFDPTEPERQLPHGRPREVVLMLQDYFARKSVEPNSRTATRERRRLPGREPATQACAGSPFDCAMRSARAEVELQFSVRGCIGCHVVVDTRSVNLLERFEVHPVRLTGDYFPAARFSHRSHSIQGQLTGDAACLSCHAAKDSHESSDLLLPPMAQCEQCHGDRTAMERVPLDCVSCHAYHPHRQGPHRQGRVSL